MGGGVFEIGVWIWSGIGDFYERAEEEGLLNWLITFTFTYLQ